jgi:hypothetical protein
MAAKGFAERLVARRGIVQETRAEHLLRPPIIIMRTTIGVVMRSGLLWMIGIPIPIILMIALFSGHL